MTDTFQSRRRVEFRDTDAAGIVHFSVFFAYMEEAEHELLRHLGLSVISQCDGKTISWPRVAARCDYRKAIKFEQVVSIDVSVTRIGHTSISYQFLFTDEQGDLVAEGTLSTVCCEIPQNGDLHSPLKPKPFPIPPPFRKQLDPYWIRGIDPRVRGIDQP